MGKTTLRNPRLAAKVARASKKPAKPAPKPTMQQQLDRQQTALHDLLKVLSTLLKNQQYQNVELHSIRADLIELRELLQPKLFDVQDTASHRADAFRYAANMMDLCPQHKPTMFPTRWQRFVAWLRGQKNPQPKE